MRGVGRPGRALERLRATRRRRQLTESLWASGAIQLALVGSGIFIARGLGPAGRGDLALLVLLPSVATQVMCLGVPAAATYFIAKHQAVWRAITRHVVLVGLAQVGVSILLLYGLNAYFLADKSDATRVAGTMMLASVPLLIGTYYLLAIYQGLGDIRWFNVYRVASPALFTLGLIVLLPFGLTIEGAAAVWVGSLLLVTLTMAAMLAIRARRHRHAHGDSGSAPGKGEIVRFGAAGFLAQVSPIESFRVDQLVTAVLFSSEVLGYYVVASSVSNIPRFLADGVAAVAYPHVAERPVREGLEATRRYLIVATVLCGGTAIGIAIVLPWLIPLLFGASFEPAISIGIILVLAAGLISIRRVGVDCLRGLGRPGAATVNEILTWIVLVPSFLVLGRWGEGDGIALSLVIAAAVGLILLLAVLHRQRAASAAPGQGA